MKNKEKSVDSLSFWTLSFLFRLLFIQLKTQNRQELNFVHIVGTTISYRYRIQKHTRHYIMEQWN